MRVRSLLWALVLTSACVGEAIVGRAAGDGATAPDAPADAFTDAPADAFTDAPAPPDVDAPPPDVAPDVLVDPVGAAFRARDDLPHAGRRPRPATPLSAPTSPQQPATPPRRNSQPYGTFEGM